VGEGSIGVPDPRQLVQQLAHAKALAVAEHVQLNAGHQGGAPSEERECVVIGCDSVLLFKGET